MNSARVKSDTSKSLCFLHWMNLLGLSKITDITDYHLNFRYSQYMTSYREKLSSLTMCPLLFPRMLQDRGLSSPPGLLERVLELKDTHCSPYLLAFLFDCYEDALENSNQKENVGEEERKETLRKALEVSSYRRKPLQLWFLTWSVCFEGSGLIYLRDELKMLPLLLFSHPFCPPPPKDLWTSGTREGHHP